MLNSWQESTLLISTLEWISLSGACKLRANKTQMYQPVVRSAPATADHLAVPAAVVSRLQVLLRPCLETGRVLGLHCRAPYTVVWSATLKFLETRHCCQDKAICGRMRRCTSRPSGRPTPSGSDAAVSGVLRSPGAGPLVECQNQSFSGVSHAVHTVFQPAAVDVAEAFKGNAPSRVGHTQAKSRFSSF